MAWTFAQSLSARVVPKRPRPPVLPLGPIRLRVLLALLSHVLPPSSFLSVCPQPVPLVAPLLLLIGITKVRGRRVELAASPTPLAADGDDDRMALRPSAGVAALQRRRRSTRAPPHAAAAPHAVVVCRGFDTCSHQRRFPQELSGAT